MEIDKGRSDTDSNRGIKNGTKALWETDREIRLGLDDWSITESLFTCNSENNTKSVGYEMKTIKKWCYKKKDSTIHKTTGWCPLLWHFLPGNNIRPESKEIMIIIIPNKY